MKTPYQLKPIKKAILISTLALGSLTAVTSVQAGIVNSGFTPFVSRPWAGSNYTFQAKVTDSTEFPAFEPTGSLTFSVTAIDGDPVAIPLCTVPLVDDGIANFQSSSQAATTCNVIAIHNIAGVKPGSLQITASYSGDSHLLPESSVLGGALVLTKADATIPSVTLADSNIILGQSNQVNVSISGYQPSGHVSVQIGDIAATANVLASGNDATATAFITLPAGVTNNGVMYIYYSGDSNNNSASTSRSINFADASSQFRLSAPASSGPSGQPLQLTMTAPSGSLPTGGVRFTDNGQVIPGCESLPIVGGVAKCTVTGITTGQHTFVATYTGGDMGTKSAELTYQAVGKRKFETLVTSEYLPASKEVQMNVTASEFQKPIDNSVITRKIRVTARDYSCDAPLDAGKGSCNVPANLSVSTVIKANFEGDDEFDPSDTLITVGDAMGFPENGWYYAPSQPTNGLPLQNGPGVGYFIDSRVAPEGIKFSMAIQTYRPEDGKAYWYLATGLWTKVSQGWSVMAPVVEYCCGSDIYQRYVGFGAAGSVGTASLLFKNTRQATLNLGMVKSGNEELAIQRFLIGDPSLKLNAALPETGLYYNVKEPGTGLAAEFRNQETFTTYFGYKDSKPIWYLTSGPSGFPSLFFGNWLEYRNGKPLGNFPYRAPELIPGKVSDVTFQYSSPLYFMWIDPSGQSTRMDRYEW